MHFVAGPWFTVIECNGQWTTADSIVISDGLTHVDGEIQIKVRLIDPALDNPTAQNASLNGPQSIVPESPKATQAKTTKAKTKLKTTNSTT